MFYRKSLSPQFEPNFQELVRRLNFKKSFLLVFSNSNDDGPDVVITSLRNLLAEHDPIHTPAIAREISSKMESILYKKFGHGRWREPQALINSHPDLACIFTVHWSGYIREQAVKGIRRVESSFELALLLVRLNDWVEQVRAAASQKLIQLIDMPTENSGMTDDVIVDCMGLLLTRGRFGRSQASDFAAIERLMKSSSVESLLLAQIIESPLDRSPRYLKYAIKLGLFAQELEVIAATAKHAETRRFAYAIVLNNAYDYPALPNYDRLTLARIALDDPLAGVISQALDYILREMPSELHIESVYRKFIAHKSWSVAERAILGLEKLGFDLAAEMRSHIKTGKLTSNTLKLASRIGTTADGGEIFRHTDKSETRTNLLALGVSAKLGHDPAKQQLEKIALYSHDNFSARTACQYLSKADCRLSYEQIETAITSGQQIVARGYIQMICRLSTIDLAQAIVSMQKASIEYEYSNLLDRLARKRLRAAFMPTPAEINALREDLKDNETLSKTIEQILWV